MADASLEIVLVDGPSMVGAPVPSGVTPQSAVSTQVAPPFMSPVVAQTEASAPAALFPVSQAIVEAPPTIVPSQAIRDTAVAQVPTAPTMPGTPASGRQPAAPQAHDHDIATLGEGAAALARVGGFGPAVSAVQMLVSGVGQILAVAGSGSSGPASQASGPAVSVPSSSAGVAAATNEAGEEEGAAAVPAAAGAGEGAAAMLGPIGIAAAGLLALGFAATKTTEALADDARKLSEFNAQLSGAEAIADLRQQLAEMRRAQENGKDLAEFTDAMSRIGTDIYDIMTHVEGFFLKIINPILEQIADMLDFITGEDSTDDLLKPDPFTEGVMGQWRAGAGGIAAPGMMRGVANPAVGNANTPPWLRDIIGGNAGGI